MINQLHWFPLSARIQFKVLSLVLKSKLGLATKYLTDLIRSPLLLLHLLIVLCDLGTGPTFLSHELGPLAYYSNSILCHHWALFMKCSPLHTASDSSFWIAVYFSVSS